MIEYLAMLKDQVDEFGRYHIVNIYKDKWNNNVYTVNANLVKDKKKDTYNMYVTLNELDFPIQYCCGYFHETVSIPVSTHEEKDINSSILDNNAIVDKVNTAAIKLIRDTRRDTDILNSLEVVKSYETGRYDCLCCIKPFVFNKLMYSGNVIHHDGTLFVRINELHESGYPAKFIQPTIIGVIDLSKSSLFDKYITDCFCCECVAEISQCVYDIMHNKRNDLGKVRLK